MTHDAQAGPPRRAWAYAYEIVPPQTEDRLRTVQALLEAEGVRARRDARTWEGRFVHEEQVTHILVVSDTAEQDLEFNQRLEAELRALEAPFSLTAPMAVDDETGPA